MPERPAPPSQRPADPIQCAAILQVLRDAGWPLQRGALQARSQRLADWAPGDFFLTVTAMLEGGKVYEWAERTIVLPGYRGRM